MASIQQVHRYELVLTSDEMATLNRCVSELRASHDAQRSPEITEHEYQLLHSINDMYRDA